MTILPDFMDFLENLYAKIVCEILYGRWDALSQQLWQSFELWKKRKKCFSSLKVKQVYVPIEISNGGGDTTFRISKFVQTRILYQFT